MDFELSTEQERLRREIHDYLDDLVTPELEAELQVLPEGGSAEEAPHYAQCVKRLGEDRWLGIGWPKEYGGRGLGPLEQYMFLDAALGYYGIPLPVLALQTVGPTIMQEGTPEQKERFLPPILTGELNIAIGYTEPSAGTDLASLKTTAVRDGDHYVINGQKVFTTLAHFCDYIWLAARTDPAAKKHKGISIFMVDTKSPGFKTEPLNCMGGFRTNFTYYEDVRVPANCLIGAENRGWYYINHQLAMERLTVVPHSKPRRAIDEMIQWAKQARLDGAPVIEKPWVRTGLTELVRDAEVARLFNYRVAWQVSQGMIPHAEASMVKVFGSELQQRVYGFALRMMGLLGQIEGGSERVPIGGKLARDFLAMVLMTFGGGANEVLRDVIAMAALGMPRSR
ncbi:MAG: acyl-CoA dehydrogenase family protein [Deltaproteobacteria bacterium]|nr:acyl-CoA dehydrogenase family protein [Deltaproteobacteria bacterium]